jgi:hypothetical protein
MTRMRDKKSLREREIEDTKPQKARSFRAQQELEVEGIWGIERKGNGKGERERKKEKL